MSFWNSEKLCESQAIKKLIDPFEQGCVKHGAYELSLGEEALVTSEPAATKRRLQIGEQLVIPPGQFGLLLTNEIVSVPANAIGFISIRFSLKRRGLVNVSGFHVDPGYRGCLEFAVYNAGSQNIVLSRGDRMFMIWFSDLSAPTKDVYNGENAGRKEITSEDSMRIQGEIASPAALKQQIDKLRSDHDQRLTALDDKITTWRWFIMTILSALIVGIVLLILRTFVQSPPTTSNPPIESIPPKAAVQNVNRSESAATNTNSNSGVAPSNSAENLPRRTR